MDKQFRVERDIFAAEESVSVWQHSRSKSDLEKAKALIEKAKKSKRDLDMAVDEADRAREAFKKALENLR